MIKNRFFCIYLLFNILILIRAKNLGVDQNGHAVEHKNDGFMTKILLDCSDFNCVKNHFLSFIDTTFNFIDDESRSAKDIDEAIFNRVRSLMTEHNWKLKLPNVVSENALVTYSPQIGLTLDDTDERSLQESGRGLLKKKLLMTLLLLLKLKFKILIPIFMAIIGIKAIKALIISKLTMLMVLGFLAAQLAKKAGMSMMLPTFLMSPGANGAAATAADLPMNTYGVPMSSYGVPSGSYEANSNGWDHANSVAAAQGPYSRIWTDESSGDFSNSPYSSTEVKNYYNVTS